MAAGTLPTRTRHRWHAPEKGSGPAFALSLLAHALLFISIAFVVRWKSEPVGPVSAELWSLPPPAASLPQPQPVPTPPPPPQPKAEPLPPQPEPRKPDIVIEQKKAPPRIEPKQEVPPKKDELKKVDPPKKVEMATKTEPIQKPPDPGAATQRALALANTGATPVAGGGSSNAYAAQVQSCIRPHIIFEVPAGTTAGRYVARFEVNLLPTGEQAVAPRLLKSSGLAAYDQAVERAIRRCDPFPVPKDGRVPTPLPLLFDPIDQ